MTWKRLVREFFTYNKREKRGLAVLLFFILVVVAFRLSIHLWPNQAQLSNHQKEKLAMLQASIHEVDSEEELVMEEAQTKQEENLEISPFDINEASVDFLVKTGLNSKAAHSLINYVKAGAVIKNRTQLLKVYNMDSNWVDSLKSYIIYANVSKPEKTFQAELQDTMPSRQEFNQSKNVWVKLNLNQADSASLLKIPGVGGYTAKEIIKLRNALGGIREYSQLTLIYRMRDETIETLLDRTYIDSKDFHLININSVKADELGKHPYISWKQAKAVVNYRFQHGDYSKVSDVKKCGIIDDSTYLNIEPYLFIP